MKPGPVTNLGSIGGAPDPTTVPEVATGMRKLHADQGYSQSNQPVKAKSPKRNPQCLEVSCKTRSRCRASWSRVQWRGLLGHRWASELSVHPSSSAQTLRHLAFTSSSRKRAAIAPCASRALRRRDVPHRRLAPHHAVWWLAVSQRRGAPRPTRSQPAQQPHSCRAWPPQLPALPQLRAPW